MIWNRRSNKHKQKESDVLLLDEAAKKAAHERRRLKSCLRRQGDSDLSCSEASQMSTTMRCASLEGETSTTASSSHLFCSSGSKQQDVPVSVISSQPSTSATGSRVSSSSTSKRSGPSKSVRFSEVHVREYERIVGDNPSCTSGPPVGIGWAHGKTIVRHVDNLENNGYWPYNRPQLEMVLTRDEREKLLYSWGATPTDIATATRALHKAKNQRRQTVRNSNKAPRLEETIESARRKLKRVLFYKSRTASKVKKLQQQADLEEKIMSELHLDEPEHVPHPTTDKPESNVSPSDGHVLKNLEVSVARYSPQDSSRRGSGATWYTAGAASCLSGFTLSDSTTNSQLEIERFYEELENDLFGEESLSLIGQTLEVEGVEIPEEDRVYVEPESVCGMEEPSSVVDSASGSGSSAKYPGFEQFHQAMNRYAAIQRQLSMANGACPNLLFPPTMLPSEPIPYTHAIGYEGTTTQQHVVAPVSPIMTPAALHNPPCPPPFGQPTQQSYPQHQQHQGNTGFNYAFKNGPTVEHNPLPNHLSLATLMDGPTGHSRTLRPPANHDPVVITEDDDDIEDPFAKWDAWNQQNASSTDCSRYEYCARQMPTMG